MMQDPAAKQRMSKGQGFETQVIQPATCNITAMPKKQPFKRWLSHEFTIVLCIVVNVINTQCGNNLNALPQSNVFRISTAQN